MFTHRLIARTIFWYTISIAFAACIVMGGCGDPTPAAPTDPLVQPNVADVAPCCVGGPKGPPMDAPKRAADKKKQASAPIIQGTASTRWSREGTSSLSGLRLVYNPDPTRTPTAPTLDYEDYDISASCATGIVVKSWYSFAEDGVQLTQLGHLVGFAGESEYTWSCGGVFSDTLAAETTVSYTCSFQFGGEDSGRTAWMTPYIYVFYDGGIWGKSVWHADSQILPPCRNGSGGGGGPEFEVE